MRTRTARAAVLATLAVAVLLGMAAHIGRAQTRGGDVNLLARLIAAEAEGEPYQGMVAVGAVMLNRVASPKFPNSVSGCVFQPGAFESVSNGLIWRRSPSRQAISAARDALNGYDPTYGCLFFWNPSKPVSGWIWSRSIAARIGKHVFAR
jgi:N-acetylmuramoyl-L-alanine amidase